MPAKKKKRTRLRWGRILLCVLVLAVAVSGVVVFARYKEAEHRLENGKNAYIAVMGIDDREGLGSTRSDVNMLVHVDFQDSRVDLVSLPRDSYVRIPCLSDETYDKLTHAFFYGDEEGGRKEAASCGMQAIAGAFDLTGVDKYVVVTFDTFEEIVDDLGGVDITPSKSFCELDADLNTLCYTAGEPTHMNGDMALTYARHRNSDSDVYRTKRAQEVVMAILAKAKTISLTDMTKIADTIMQNLDTNITAYELIQYYRLSQRENFTFNHMTAPGEDDYIDDVYYYRLDEDWVNQMKEKIRSDGF